MADIVLSPFKKKLIEDWAKEVSKFYKDGSICRYVLSSINKDTHDNEIAIRPSESQQSERIIRESTGNSRTPRFSECRTRENTNIQSLPAVALSYLHVNDKRHTDIAKVNILNLARDEQRLYKSRRHENNAMEEGDEECPPLVIVDPQMITPAGNLPNYQRRETTIHIQNSPRLPTRHRESSFTYRRQPGEVFTNCKIHSSGKNSFVVSRTNIRGSMHWKNHSFLDLPARFRNSENVKTPKISQPKIPKEPSELVKNTENVATPTVWAW